MFTRTLCTAAVIAGATVSQAQDSGTLDQDYNLGRIIGPATRTLLLTDQENGTFMLQDALEVQFGTPDQYQWSIPLILLHMSYEDNSMSVLGAAGAAASIRPADGHRLDFSLFTLNPTIWSTDDETHVGFETEYFNQNYQFHVGHSMLTNQGQIQLAQSEYDLAFLKGPLLDAGQYRHTAAVDFDPGSDGDGWNGLTYSAAYGIIPNLQASLGYHLEKQNTTYEYYDPYYGYLYVDTTVKTHDLDVGVSFRTANVWADAGLYQSGGEYLDDLSDLNTTRLGISAGYLSQSRGLSAQQVAGNWNHFFNDVLGEKQLLVQFSGSAQRETRLVSVTKEEDHFYTNLSPSVDYGVLPNLTLGTTFYMNGWDEWGSTKFAKARAAISNVPLRSKGPSEVSALEYEVGYLPIAGEFKILASYVLPILDNPEFTVSNASMDDETLEESLTSTLNAVDWTGDFLARTGNLSIWALYGFTDKWFGIFQWNYGASDFLGGHAITLEGGMHDDHLMLSLGVLLSQEYDEFGEADGMEPGPFFLKASRTF